MRWFYRLTWWFNDNSYLCPRGPKIQCPQNGTCDWLERCIVRHGEILFDKINPLAAFILPCRSVRTYFPTTLSSDVLLFKNQYLMLGFPNFYSLSCMVHVSLINMSQMTAVLVLPSVWVIWRNDNFLSPPISRSPAGFGFPVRVWLHLTVCAKADWATTVSNYLSPPGLTGIIA